MQEKLMLEINEREGLKQSQSELAALKERNTFLTSERDKLRDRKGELPETAFSCPPETNTPASAKPPTSAEGIAKKMQGPEMKKMMRSQMERQTRKSFGDILLKWNVSTTDTDLVMSLLIDRSAVFTESGMDIRIKSSA